jgi:hypothetical protein
MHFLNRYAAIFAVATVASLIFAGCGGDSKSVQCNLLITTANKIKATTPPKDITGFTELADRLDKIRTEVQTANVRDRQLKDLQTRLVSMYGDAAQALRARSKSFETKDSEAFKKAGLDIEAALKQESVIADEVNAYCGSS